MSKTEHVSDIRGWRKSSYSVANGACTEVTGAGGAVLVRDSVSPAGGQLRFPAVAWQEFTGRIKWT
jgi:hypothetical protein